VLPFDGRVTGFRARFQEISHEGLFVMTTRALPVDSLVVLRLVIDRLTVEITAQLIHTIGGHGFGCQFLDLDQEARSTVGLMVAACNAAPKEMRTIPPSMTRRADTDSVTRPRHLA